MCSEKPDTRYRPSDFIPVREELEVCPGSIWFHFCKTLVLSTSQLYFLNAHVHHHGTRGVVSFDQSGEVTAEHFFNPAQVRLAVAGHQFGALFVYIQPTV